MHFVDRAERCRRLAREVIGDPMETALLSLAEEYEGGQARATPSRAERQELRAAADSWLQRAERAGIRPCGTSAVRSPIATRGWPAVDGGGSGARPR